jgi:hypothetical protein
MWGNIHILVFYYFMYGNTLNYFKVSCFITFLLYKAWECFIIIMCMCLAQVKINDIQYVEIIDLWCINFLSFEDFGSTMTKEQRIIFSRCLQKMLKVNSSIWHIHIFNIRNLLSILFQIAHCKIHHFWNVFMKNIIT